MLRMANRDFNIIQKMFSLNGESLIIKHSSSLEFKINGFRYFMLNNSNIKRKDLLLRFKYIKTNANRTQEKTDLLDLIDTNIQDSLSDINTFKSIEKDSKVEIINKAILENKKLLVSKNHDQIVNPLKIYFDNGYWYLAALKDDENSYRIRIDNINKIKLLESNILIKKEILEKNRLMKWDAFGNENSEKKCTIILELDDEKTYKYFKLKKYKIQQKEFIKEGKYYVEFKFNYDWEIKPLLFQWIDVITIIDLDCGSSEEDTEFLQSFYNSSKEFFSRKEHEPFFGNII